MFKTRYRDLAATLCGTLGMLTIAVSLILTPLPAWGDEPDPYLGHQSCDVTCSAVYPACGTGSCNNPTNPACIRYYCENKAPVVRACECRQP
jgi:hypothetical protein